MSLSPLPRLSPLSDDAENTLAAYRAASPGARRRATNLDAVHKRVSAEPPARAAAAAGLMWPLGWGLASAVAAGGLVWGLVEVRSVEVEGPEARTEASAVAAEETPSRATPRDVPPRRAVPEAPTEPVPVQRPTKIAVPPRPEPSELAPAPASSDLREETRRLRDVRASIASSAWGDAARELDAYTHAFPNGALREDAQAYRIIVRCEQGSSAKALRRAFDDRYPASPHAVRMDAACGEKKK